MTQIIFTIYYKGSEVGDLAPDFSAEALGADGKFFDFKLSSLNGKYVVLLFYPLDFTFVCPSELLAFSENAQKFRDAGAEVVGISVDSKFTHLAWTQTPKKEGGLGSPLNFPLVSDITHEISKAYNLYWHNKGHSKRGLVIVSPKGFVSSKMVNDDPVGRSWEETLRVVEALVHHDAHPDEVCPAGWKKGGKTIKEHPVHKKDYFSSVYN